MSTPGDVLNASGLVVALVALLISVYSWRTTDRAARNDVISQVREWASEVIDALSVAAGLCALSANRLADGELFMRRWEMMSTLSSLLDRGRMFFPNTYREGYGTHKPAAFQGLRPQILDVIYLAHELSRNIDYAGGTLNDRRRLAFEHVKKAFVSAVQQATGLTAPVTLLPYESFLNTTSVDPLPSEIRILAKAEGRSFQLRFTDKPLATDR